LVVGSRGEERRGDDEGGLPCGGTCGVIWGIFRGGSTFVLYRQCCDLFFAAGEEIV